MYLKKRHSHDIMSPSKWSISFRVTIINECMENPRIVECVWGCPLSIPTSRLNFQEFEVLQYIRGGAKILEEEETSIPKGTDMNEVSVRSTPKPMSTGHNKILDWRGAYEMESFLGYPKTF